jgi:phosphatidate cytidylyltransferase
LSGALGSLILSQFAFLILFLDINYKLNFNIFFTQILLSFVGQVGDILMSFIKRINNIKDTSNFIPGHGGFLDRVDGLIWIFIFGNFLNL